VCAGKVANEVRKKRKTSFILISSQMTSRCVHRIKGWTTVLCGLKECALQPECVALAENKPKKRVAAKKENRKRRHSTVTSSETKNNSEETEVEEDEKGDVVHAAHNAAAWRELKLLCDEQSEMRREMEVLDATHVEAQRLYSTGELDLKIMGLQTDISRLVKVADDSEASKKRWSAAVNGQVRSITEVLEEAERENLEAEYEVPRDEAPPNESKRERRIRTRDSRNVKPWLVERLLQTRKYAARKHHRERTGVESYMIDLVLNDPTGDEYQEAFDNVTAIGTIKLTVELLREELTALQTKRAEHIQIGVRAFAAYRDARRRLHSEGARADQALSDFDVHFTPDESEALKTNRCLWVLHKYDVAKRNLAAMHKLYS
jgi:hypothetical protein